MAATNPDAPAANEFVRARIAISAGFFSFGLAFALWAVHIPVIAQRLGLDPVTLGLALLNVGVGGVISQPLTGMLIARTGSRPAATALLPLFLATFILPVIAWSTPFFFLATFILGATGGAGNVALNTQASEIERARGRPTMSSFHGFFSLGALAGAVLGGAIIAIGWQGGSGAAFTAILLLAVAAYAARHFLPTTPAPRPGPSEKSRKSALPNGAVLGVALLAFFANMTEGAVGDWSALYLSSVRDMTVASAASGFAAFSLAMAACRLFGGPVVARFGEQRIVVFGGVLIAAGMAVVVLSPWAIVSPLGFALVAIGAANNIPVLISVASRAPGTTPSAGVAATATGALLGFLIGPPVIGFVAHATSLSVALGLLALAGIVVGVGAALYRWPAREQERAG